MGQISKELRRYVMSGTHCTSEEATEFFAHAGLFFNEEAERRGKDDSIAQAVMMAMFDICSRAAVENEDEL